MTGVLASNPDVMTAAQAANLKLFLKMSACVRWNHLTTQSLSSQRNIQGEVAATVVVAGAGTEAAASL